MTMLKLVGAAIIGLSGTALGIYYANMQKYRVKELTECKKALLILSSEIEYMQTALPEAAHHIALKTSGVISDVFAMFADLSDKNNHESAYQMWGQAWQTHRDSGHLTREDVELLQDFGKTLGYLDKKMQLNAIQLTADQLDTKINELQALNEKNKGLYRNLGMLGGLLLAVVLW
jgi:stage III sporulation protein AB